MWLTPPGPYRARTCRGRELTGSNPGHGKTTIIIKNKKTVVLTTKPSPEDGSRLNSWNVVWKNSFDNGFRPTNLCYNSGPHTYFFTTQGHGGPPLVRDQLNARATSETTQTWKTIHTIHVPIHFNKANMKEWLWRPNDIRGPCGPKASWHFCLTGEEKLRKISPRKLVPTGYQTRAPCVTGARTTACSTAVDLPLVIIRKS